MSAEISSPDLVAVSPEPNATSTVIESSAVFTSRTPRKKAVKVGFIFIGGCGCNNGERFMQDAPPAEWPHIGNLLMNSDAAQLNKIISAEPDSNERGGRFDFESNQKKGRKLENLKAWTACLSSGKDSQLSVLQLGEDGDGAGADPTVGKELAIAHTDEIKAWMKPFDLIVIVAGGGKGTGGGATPVVQKIASKEGKFPLVLITLPFKNYGRGVMTKGVNALKESYKAGGTTWAVYNDNAPESVLREDPGIMYDMINKASTLPVLFGSREVTQIVGMLNADTADWKKLIERGNVGIIYYAEWSTTIQEQDEDSEKVECESLETFTSRLLTGNPYQDTKHKDKITTILPCFHGHFPQFEQNHILGAITKDIHKNKLAELEIFPFINPANDGKKWVMIFCTAQVEDPLAVEENSAVAALSVTAQPTNGSAYPEGEIPLTERTETIYFATSYSGNSVARKVTPATADLWKKAIESRPPAESGKVRTKELDIPITTLFELVRRETGEKVIYHPQLSVHANGTSSAIQ